MKKVIAFVLAMMMCVAMCLNASATESAFAPSVTYKPAPEVVITTGDNGEQVIGTIKNEAQEVVFSASVDSLVVTPVSNADTSEKISAEAAKVLKDCFQQLNVADLNVADLCQEMEKIVENFQAIVTGAEKLAYEDVAQTGGLNLDTFEATDKTFEHVTVENLVVKDLFDVSVLDEELDGYLSEENNAIELTFSVGVESDDFVAVMVFKNDAWSAIKNVVNNGDGTITCTFDHFCPVAILTVPAAQEDPVPETEPVETEPVETEPVESEPVETEPVETPVDATADNTLWYVIIGVAVVAVIVVIVVATKKTKKSDEVKTN